MHGLTIFQHHIVGDIHNIVDGAHAHSAEPFTHPTGGRLYPDVFHDFGRIYRTKILVFDLHIQKIAAVTVPALHRGSMKRHRNVKGSGSLSCKADDRKAVRPIGGDFKLNNGVIKANSFLNRLSQSEITAVFFRQDKNPIFYGRGEIMNCKPQFAQRTQHTVAFHTAKLTFLDFDTTGQSGVMQCRGHDIALFQVLGACDNLQKGIAPCIYLADPKMVRIRVTLHFFHSGDYHIIDLRAFLGPSFHLGTTHSYCLCKFTHAHLRHFGEFLQPFHGQIHISIPRFLFLRIGQPISELL